MGILAANYGMTVGAAWAQGDFNTDGKVDVGDLGVLAANYGSGAAGVDFKADYAKVFGTTTATDGDDLSIATAAGVSNLLCSGLSISLITGMLFAGLMRLKPKEWKLNRKGLM